MNIVVFDIETTGLDKSKDFIIQFAGIKLDTDTNKIIDQKNFYIKPAGQYNISLSAYYKHGISAKFLEDKPYFKDVANEIVEFFKDSAILTYNGMSFDIPFLKNELMRVGIDYDFMKHQCYDAFLEEKRRNGNTLSDTYKRYRGKTMEEAGLTAHDALSDVKATYTIFVAQQRKQQYGPEEMLGEDNVLVNKEFQSKVQPCFNIGKYKDIAVATVYAFDKNYIAWAMNESNFTKSTKECIKKIIQNIK